MDGRATLAVKRGRSGGPFSQTGDETVAALSALATALPKMRAGASDYLAKPVDTGQSLSALRMRPHG